MIYLIIGEDLKAKDQKIEELKKKHLPSQGSYLFDYDSLLAVKLDPENFKKSLLNLAAFAPQRVVVIRSAHKLDAQNKDILLEFLQTSPKHIVLILEAEVGDQSNAFIKKLEGQAQTFRFGEKQVTSVFDMTRAVEQKNLPVALKILNDLFSEGQHPLQIIGAIVWFWGKQKPKLASKKFNEGLLALQEADLNIKRSRLSPTQAIEMLVTKLYLLQA